VIDAIHKLMERETAGDPISGLKWTRKTTDNIARQLQRLGIAVGRTTVGRLLRQMKYSLRTNRKKISAGSTSDRDRQFRYYAPAFDLEALARHFKQLYVPAASLPCGGV